ncbi:SMALL AUXIN UPREGULATED RNA 38 [Hibiscus trionum]|uniref:SMALL AUXIN UPREGULATED RNA 38 n=1 Tax=Hibiscus trionum TaxID=183268 RepID=A0A9W7H9A8_HIBTR|nr:SMALL AUXIN UPREGULATED RNA 38 [Hibiscus trionum]
MDSKKSNKISEIVRLQQILKKWKKLANASKKSGGSKSMKFLKRTLSFNDVSAGGGEVVPKGFVAVCVGKELKRYTIPMEYLGHEAFGMLLRQAEEEFGFQQEGVLKIPCQVSIFDEILNTLRIKKETLSTCYSPDSEFTTSHHPQMCR